MICSKCGRKIKENAVYCSQCEKAKNGKRKKAYWGAGITILSLMVIICILVGIISKLFLASLEGDEEKVLVENETISGFFSESPKSKPTEEDKVNKDLVQEMKGDVSEVENVDVQAEVEYIRQLYYGTQENLSAYSQYEYDDVIYYWDTDGPVRVTVKEGKEGIPYTRNYYYVNNKIYFAFLFHGTEEHRFYFKDDVMIRYINPDKEVYDYGSTDMAILDEWKKMIMEESNSVLE